MRPVVAVDLATRFSAVVGLNAGGEVTTQWDTTELGQRATVQALWLTVSQTPQCVTVIEDLPHHLPASTVIKSAAQMQGRIIQTFEPFQLANVYFVPPATWQQAMGVWRKSPVETALVAAGLGYDPPDLLAARGLSRDMIGVRTKIALAEKQMTDYVDAFLMAYWAQQCMAQGLVWDLTVIKQYRD